MGFLSMLFLLHRWLVNGIFEVKTAIEKLLAVHKGVGVGSVWTACCVKESSLQLRRVFVFWLRRKAKFLVTGFVYRLADWRFTGTEHKFCFPKWKVSCANGNTLQGSRVFCVGIFATVKWEIKTCCACWQKYVLNHLKNTKSAFAFFPPRIRQVEEGSFPWSGKSRLWEGKGTNSA